MTSVLVAAWLVLASVLQPAWSEGIECGGHRACSAATSGSALLQRKTTVDSNVEDGDEDEDYDTGDPDTPADASDDAAGAGEPPGTTKKELIKLRKNLQQCIRKAKCEDQLNACMQNKDCSARMDQRVEAAFDTQAFDSSDPNEDTEETEANWAVSVLEDSTTDEGKALAECIKPKETAFKQCITRKSTKKGTGRGGEELPHPKTQSLLQRQQAVDAAAEPTVGEVFDGVDTDSSGGISRQELSAALEKLTASSNGGKAAPAPPPPAPPPPAKGGKGSKPAPPAPAPSPPANGGGGGGDGGGGDGSCEGGVVPDCPSCGTDDQLTKDEICRHLTVHNKLRACVKPKPPPMVWDCELMCQVQKWQDTGSMGHSDCYGSPIKAGENMAMWGPQDRRYPYKAEWMWFDSEYSYRGGHYTAMIWSKSKKLGCGINEGKGTVFCQYADSAANFGSTSDPNNAGNFDGDYAACGITEKETSCWSASTASACDPNAPPAPSPPGGGSGGGGKPFGGGGGGWR